MVRETRINGRIKSNRLIDMKMQSTVTLEHRMRGSLLVDEKRGEKCVKKKKLPGDIWEGGTQGKVRGVEPKKGTLMRQTPMFHELCTGRSWLTLLWR